jgi:nucleoside-diphosphate-sugar epimerase
VRILGGGLLARGFQAFALDAPDLTIFARGVADSTSVDEGQFERERRHLHDAIGDSLRQDNRLVYFSGGGAIYGRFDGPKDERSALQPITSYGRHQARCEDIIRGAGVRHLIIRLPNVVGAPQNPRQLVPNLVAQAAKGEAVLQRHAARDLIDIDDVVRIVLRIAARIEDDETMVVATGRAVPVIEIFDEIERTLGTTATRHIVEGGEAQYFGVGRLRAMLPDSDFSEDYPRAVLRRYVPLLARLHVGVT